MKVLSLSFISFFVVLIFFQTGFSSCQKTDTITKTDTLIIKDTAISLQLLTANSWKVQEMRGVVGNTITYYLRGGSSNTDNYDNEYITFNSNKTGTYFDFAGGTHQITWDFSNTNNTKLVFVVSNPAPLAAQTVTYDNLRYKNGVLFFDQYWSYNNVNAHAQVARIPK